MNNISLRNKYLDLNKNIKFITNKHYIKVKEGDYANLNLLKDKVKEILKTNGHFITNKATGYRAQINKKTINKILFPAPRFDSYNIKYINNLNAACKLKELFKSAVYIDSLPPMKIKKKNPNELGYHHFVAPLYMNGKKYRVFITAREKANSNILYVVSAEIIAKIVSDDYKMKISVEELVKNVKLWNYDLEEYHIYNIDNIVCDQIPNNSFYQIESEIIILH